MPRFLLVIWALMTSSAYAQVAEGITNAQGYISCNPCGFSAQTGRRFPLSCRDVLSRQNRGAIYRGRGTTDASGHFDLELPDNLAEFGKIKCYIQITDPQVCTNITAGAPNMCPIIDIVTDNQLFSPAPSAVSYKRPPNPFVRSYASGKLCISVISIFSVIVFPLLCLFAD